MMLIVVPLAFVGTSASVMLAHCRKKRTASIPKYNSLSDSTPLRSTVPSGAHLYLLIIAPLPRALRRSI